MNSKFSFISCRYKWDYFFIAFLFSIIIIFSIIFYQDFNASTFSFDSTLNINIANNLLQGNGYVFNFIYEVPIFNPELNIIEKHSDVDTLLNEFPNIHSSYGKPPLYHVLLAGFFKFFSANPENWIYYGTVFSVILSSFFILIYYIFCRKYFGIHVAIFSSFIIVTSMTYIHFITTTRSNPLIWLLIISSFLFLNKTTRNFILFGILTGLSTLTHPIGIIPGISYLSYLLFKKQFKGFSIVIITWFSISLPWLIRQFETFGDFGFGYSLPFTKYISEIIQPVSESNSIIKSQVGSFFFSQIQTPFEFLNTLFLNTPWIRIFNSELIIFFLFFIVFSFVSFQYISKINKNFKLLISIFGLIVIFFFIINYFISSLNFTLDAISLHIFQIIILISVPIISVLILNYISKGKIFLKKIPDPYFIFVICGGLYIIAGYFTLHSTLTINHFVMFPFFLILLPLGMLGWKRFVNELSGQNNKRNKNIVFLVSISFLIIVPTAVFIPDNVHFYKSYSKLDDEHLTEAYSWFRENTDQKPVIATFELPSTLSLKTGNPVVIIPDEMKDLKKFDAKKAYDYINFYKITYLLADKIQPKDSFILEILSFEPVFNCGVDCKIYKFTLGPSENDLEKSDHIEVLEHKIDYLKTVKQDLKNQYDFNQNQYEKYELDLNTLKIPSYQKLQLQFNYDLLSSKLPFLNAQLEETTAKINYYKSQINYLTLNSENNIRNNDKSNNLIENTEKVFMITQTDHVQTKFANDVNIANIAIANYTVSLNFQNYLIIKSDLNNIFDNFNNDKTVTDISKTFEKDLSYNTDEKFSKLQNDKVLQKYERQVIKIISNSEQVKQSSKNLYFGPATDIYTSFMDKKLSELDDKSNNLLAEIKELKYIKSNKNSFTIFKNEQLTAIKDIINKKYSNGIADDEGKKMYVEFLKQKIIDWDGDSLVHVLIFYDELLVYDNDPKVWESKALLLEQSGKIKESIKSYNVLMNLVSPEESREIYQKVKELQKNDSE